MLHDGAYDTPMRHGKPGLTVIDHADAISKKVPEVAKLLGIGERLAWHLVSTGVLPSFKIGNVRLVRLSDVQAYVNGLVAEERALRERAHVAAVDSVA